MNRNITHSSLDLPFLCSSTILFLSVQYFPHTHQHVIYHLSMISRPSSFLCINIYSSFLWRNSTTSLHPHHLFKARSQQPYTQTNKSLFFFFMPINQAFHWHYISSGDSNILGFLWRFFGLYSCLKYFSSNVNIAALGCILSLRKSCKFVGRKVGWELQWAVWASRSKRKLRPSSLPVQLVIRYD